MVRGEEGGGAMEGFAYRGHYVWLDPDGKGDHWEAHVGVEIHAKGAVEKIWYRDPEHVYPTRDEAAAACVVFAKKMIDTFTVPAYGEGELKTG
jgi:hypothetical protein